MKKNVYKNKKVVDIYAKSGMIVSVPHVWHYEGNQ